MSTRQRQWLWFIALWLGGVLALTAIALPLRLLLEALTRTG